METEIVDVVEEVGVGRGGNHKLIPMHIRQEAEKMYRAGVRPSEIRRHLSVSRGALAGWVSRGRWKLDAVPKTADAKELIQYDVIQSMNDLAVHRPRSLKEKAIRERVAGEIARRAALAFGWAGAEGATRVDIRVMAQAKVEVVPPETSEPPQALSQDGSEVR